MSYRFQISSQPETLQDFEVAADARYWDAVHLAVESRQHGAIYLFGYVAEIRLKLACFRIDRARPSDPIASLLGPVRTYQRRYLPTLKTENYHSLEFWLYLLRHKRTRLGQPLLPPFDQRLVQCVRRIHSSWRVEMRYRADSPSLQDMVNVYNDVSWLHTNAHLLWSWPCP